MHLVQHADVCHCEEAWTGARCAFLYHNENFFGLSQGDYLEVLKSAWEGGERKKKADIKIELQNWKAAGEVGSERNKQRIPL